GAVFTHPIATGSAIFDLGGDGLKDFLHMRPRGGIAARHDRRPMARAFLASRYAGPDEEYALFSKIFRAAAGVRPVRIAPVDDDVALLEVRQDILNHVVDGVARLHHQHDAPGWFE